MAEIILRIIGILIEGLIEGVFESTGRKVLSHWGMKSNPFVELLVGILFWAAVFLLLLILAVFAHLLFRSDWG
ncbi:hypothetical protein I6F30_06560 [Bradyrhizobium sp. NBAIM20]|uniref:Uncharacterized protein n=1 Tax=Bradyrhizobium yuanmingense TaxID=108015 RepID=A0ABV4GDE9_9BRAD|nr:MULTISPECIES: hypothetical protein [Bradyrhizobium]MCA1410832.1 hypothetical protein [Bradyrhizobium sp. NBAIM20]MCA1461658.1 hypothetical protein [Bradyrhizobium sp. NBAIM18]